VISVFRLEVDEMCALLGRYATYGGNSLPTFRDNLSVPSSRGKVGKNYHYTLSNILQECRSEVSMRIQAVVLSFIKHNQNLFSLTPHFSVISVTFVPKPQVYQKEINAVFME
jgi:hypothetical protein